MFVWFSFVLFTAIRKHPLFRDIDWSTLHDTEAPFVPCPNDDTDTSYFDGRQTLFQLFITHCIITKQVALLDMYYTSLVYNMFIIGLIYVYTA